MPELPDVDVYVEHIEARTRGRELLRVRVASPFVVRTAVPPLSAAHGHKVMRVSRLGKRIVFHLAGDLKLVVHLMIAGRFQWRPAGALVPKKVGLAAFDFEEGSLVLTEASSKKRASIHLVAGEEALAAMDPGGIEVLTATRDDFARALTRTNHTLKRALTDPRILSGVGNAYSDEILFAARLSPFKQTEALAPEEMKRLYEATQHTLVAWRDRLRASAGQDFPEKVTAFRPEMAVHGKYKKPCPVCGAPVQRVRYADNEANYCARCQTAGKLLADRGLSRLLGKDWPKTLDDLEQRMREQRTGESAPKGSRRR